MNKGTLALETWSTVDVLILLFLSGRRHHRHLLWVALKRRREEITDNTQVRLRETTASRWMSPQRQQFIDGVDPGGYHPVAQNGVIL